LLDLARTSASPNRSPIRVLTVIQLSGIDDGGSATYTVSNSLFQNNSALYGGSVYTFGTANSTWINNTFIGNSALNAGGAVYTTGTSPTTWIDNKFEGNSAISGGVLAHYSAGVTTFINNQFIGNKANVRCNELLTTSNGLKIDLLKAFGAAIELHFGISFSDCLFESNESPDSTFYIIGDLAVELRDTLFRNNTGGTVGCIHIEAASNFIPLLFENLQFTNNKARSSAAGILVTGSSDLTLISPTFTNVRHYVWTILA